MRIYTAPLLPQITTKLLYVHTYMNRISITRGAFVGVGGEGWDGWLSCEQDVRLKWIVVYCTQILAQLLKNQLNNQCVRPVHHKNKYVVKPLSEQLTKNRCTWSTSLWQFTWFSIKANRNLHHLDWLLLTNTTVYSKNTKPTGTGVFTVYWW